MSHFLLRIIMSLAHVLLTSLLEKPSTGFDLARRFDRSMGFFWNATHQQIYRELNGMLKKGWISTLEEQAANSRKKNLSSRSTRQNRTCCMDSTTKRTCSTS